MKILFAGGGTGGHILPIIAIVREIRKIYTGKNPLDFYYLGPKDEFSSILLSQEGINVKNISAGKIRRYITPLSILENIVDILIRTPLGILQAFSNIFFIAPDLIFSKGGYGSLPVVISGWFLMVPILMHESDISPGLTNRFLSRFSLDIFTSFPKTEHIPISKMILVGNPIRSELLQGSKKEAERLFNLIGTKPIILIIGGSQGAQRLNDTLLNILPKLLVEFEVIHQCGDKNFKQVKAESRAILNKELQKYYHLFPFFKEPQLKHAYQACDLVVGRAGSGTIFEVSALSKPSILVPLPEAAQNHQFKNAYAYAKRGAALVIEEPNLTPHFFLERLKFLLSRPKELEKMSQSAKEFAEPDAARVIAGYIVDYLTNGK